MDYSVETNSPARIRSPNGIVIIETDNAYLSTTVLVDPTTPSDDSPIPHSEFESAEQVLLPSETECRDNDETHSRVQRWLNVAAAFALIWISIGTEFSDGIVYSRLLLPPCTEPSPQGTTNTSQYLYLGNSTQGNEYGNATDPEEVQYMTSTQSLDLPDHLWSMNSSDGALDSPCDNVTQSTANTSSRANESKAECGGFGQGAAATAWVNSLTSGVRSLTTVFAPHFFDAFGLRPMVLFSSAVFAIGLLSSSFANHLYWVYIARGVVSGVGSGFLSSTPVYALSVSSGNDYALMSGIAYTAVGCSCVFNGYVGKEIITAYNWRWYYRMICLLSITGLLAAFHLGHSQHRRKNTLSSVRRDRAVSRLRANFLDLIRSCGKSRTLYKNGNFLVCILISNMAALGSSLPMVVAAHRAELLGVRDNEIYVQTSYLGYGSIAGSLCYTLCAWHGRRRISNTVRIGVIFMAMGLTIALSSLIKTKADLIVCNVIYMMFRTSSTAGWGPFISDVVPSEHTALAYGHLNIVCAPVVFLGPPLAGFVFDKTNSYALPCVVGGVVIASSGIIAFLVEVRIRQLRKRSGPSAGSSLATARPVR
eukprot:scpid56412/ scgid0351/ 